MTLECDYQDVDGPADRAVLLAHGAGSDRNGPVILAVVQALRRVGVPSLRFDYPYRTAGRRSPDRPPALRAATEEAAQELAARSGLAPGRLVLGGRSMGGRFCSLLAAESPPERRPRGLVLLAYPLHPAGRPDEPRTAHFPGLDLPVLFVSGDRDALGAADALEAAAKAIPGPVTFHWIEGGDHGYRVPRRMGRSPEEVVDEVARVTASWVAALPA